MPMIASWRPPLTMMLHAICQSLCTTCKIRCAISKLRMRNLQISSLNVTLTLVLEIVQTHKLRQQSLSHASIIIWQYQQWSQALLLSIRWFISYCRQRVDYYNVATFAFGRRRGLGIDPYKIANFSRPGSFSESSIKDRGGPSFIKTQGSHSWFTNLFYI